MPNLDKKIDPTFADLLFKRDDPTEIEEELPTEPDPQLIEPDALATRMANMFPDNPEIAKRMLDIVRAKKVAEEELRENTKGERWGLKGLQFLAGAGSALQNSYGRGGGRDYTKDFAGYQKALLDRERGVDPFETLGELSKAQDFESGRLGLSTAKRKEEQALKMEAMLDDPTGIIASVLRRSAIALGMKGAEVEGMGARELSAAHPYLTQTYKALTDRVKADRPGLGESITKGMEAFAKTQGQEAAKDIAGFDPITAGRNKAVLDQSINELEALMGKTISGLGPLQGRAPDWAKDLFVGEDARAIQNNVREISMALLRQTLGAQFTEKEGERIMKFLFDPTLPENTLRKMKAFSIQMGAITNAAQDKAQWGREHGGDMSGYIGADPWNVYQSIYTSFGEKREEEEKKEEIKVLNGIQYRKVPGGWEAIE